MSDTISLENAIFVQSNKEEIDEIIKNFKILRGKILPNTLLQLTRWDLIQKFYDVSPFVDSNEITKNTLKLIIDCIEEAEGVLNSEDYKKLENIFQQASKIKSKLISEK